MANSASFQSIKGEGCSNTFLVYDCLDHESYDHVLQEAHASLLKSKRDDALILIKVRESRDELVMKMLVLEPDGSLAEFCGNGARVIARYLKHRFGDNKRNYFLKTSKRMCRLWWEEDNYFVDMGKTSIKGFKSHFLNVHLEGLKLGLGLKFYQFFLTETMEPHLVTFDSISEKELHDLGEYVNGSQRDFFPLGINLNQAVVSGNGLQVITYERGVNRITAACGTGATSSAWLARATRRINGDSIIVEMKGGSVKILIVKGRSILTGPAHIEL